MNIILGYQVYAVPSTFSPLDLVADFFAMSEEEYVQIVLQGLGIEKFNKK